jgi:hypothetical protein
MTDRSLRSFDSPFFGSDQHIFRWGYAHRGRIVNSRQAHHKKLFSDRAHDQAIA